MVYVNGVKREDAYGKCCICGCVFRGTLDDCTHFFADYRERGGKYDDPQKFRCRCGTPVFMSSAEDIRHDDDPCEAFRTLSKPRYIEHMFGPVAR